MIHPGREHYRMGSDHFHFLFHVVSFGGASIFISFIMWCHSGPMSPLQTDIFSFSLCTLSTKQTNLGLRLHESSM